MTETSTLDRVRQIVAWELNTGLDRVAADSNLFTDLGGDDLDRINVVMAIEEAFPGPAITDRDMQAASTVTDFVALAERRPLPRREGA